jgi:hypothetical protein
VAPYLEIVAKWRKFATVWRSGDGNSVQSVAKLSLFATEEGRG